ncbi:MAG: CHAP domain-containing protein [Candidatus Moranbacteria bacterium]|nr:CHAP domain-containing protein [Candidatus Moranbacteria bacterium]
MRFLLIKLLLAVIAICFSSYVISGDESCKGYTSVGNPFRCGAKGNCVWWAIYKRPDLGEYELHDPISEKYGNWYQIAKDAGFGVGQSPANGAIAVFSKPSHVAYVENINADDSFYASEMDWYGMLGNGNGVQYATYHPYSGGYKRENSSSASLIVGFIYYRATPENPNEKEGKQICDVTKGKCDIKSYGSVGWFPPVFSCWGATQWFIMSADQDEGSYPIGYSDISACNQVPRACFSN